MPNDDSLQDDVRTFHGEVMEREYCLGSDCPDKNCAICLAADKRKFNWDITDDYRKKVKAGYYTTTIVEVVDPETGKKKYVYTRPG